MLTIVIVSFNSAATLQRCQHELLASGGFPVIVVDNASRDGSADSLERLYPAVQVMRMGQNEGYGRAANRALQEVTTPFAFLLNPDMQADTAGVQAMLDFAQQHQAEASLFAPAVVETDYLQQGAVQRSWLIGAALLFKLDAFKDLGFFDENIFLFSEETDLCQRLLKQGHKILLNTDLYIHHLLGQSALPNPKVDALKDWHFGWSKLYYLHKHGLISGWWAPRWLWLQYRLKAGLATKPVKRNMYRARAAGMQAYLRGEGAFLSNGRGQGTDKL